MRSWGKAVGVEECVGHWGVVTAFSRTWELPGDRQERQTGRPSLTSEGLFAWTPPRLSPWGWPDHVLIVTQPTGREVAVNLECALQDAAVVSA